ncbi:flagellar basal-body MS-ring/collar protein FliF [Porticoccus sp.]
MSSAPPIAESTSHVLQTGVPSLTSANAILHKLRGNNSLVLAMMLGAAAVAVIMALFIWAETPEYRVLFSNLSEADGGRIINELDKRTAPYRFSEGGNAILVPEDQVHMLRLQLAEQGLPNGAGVGFELMDNQAFGISQFAEQLNFQRGLEGELVRSIQALWPVVNARIHLALAKESVFVRNREPAKASVLVTLHPGRVLDPGQVNAIVHLVSSSVSGLTTNNITVVDQNGNLLSNSGRPDTRQERTQLDHVQEVENTYRERIENTLTPLFGRNNIHVQVTAQIDFSSREETVEHFVPNQDGASAAVRSAQWSTNLDGSDAVAAGIPGALSNAPPTSPPPAKGKGDKAGNSPAAKSGGSLQRENTVNYEVDRNIIHIQHQSARIERLSSAVVVNYRSELDEEGNPLMKPLDEEELQQVTLLVKQSMGFSEARGDQVQVVNSPFTEQPASEAAAPELTEPPFWKTVGGQQLILSLARYLAAAIGALVIFQIVLRPLLRKHLQPSPTPRIPIPPTMLGAGIPDPSGEPAAENIAARKSLDGRRRKASNYEQSIDEVRQAAKDDPRLIAMIVRSWINKG